MKTSCIRSHESAGHMVVCVVTDHMVGDRQSPGATILGGRDYLPPPPTIAYQSRRQVPYLVTGAFGFWDFGSLHIKALRRPWPTVVAAAQSALLTVRRHNASFCGRGGCKRKGFAAFVADCLDGSGHRERAVVHFVCRHFWTTVPVLRCAHEPTGRGLVVCGNQRCFNVVTFVSQCVSFFLL